MSVEHLEDEPVEELYGEYIDENYQWRPSASQEAETEDSPGFLNDGSETDVDLMTGEGSDQ
jgi:hypothetical protein